MMSEALKPVKGIGGSDISAILGIPSFSTRRSVYNRVMGLTVDKDAEYLEWGNRNEPAIIQKFLDEHPGLAFVANRGVVYKRGVGEGTPDGVLGVAAARFILEVKNVGGHRRDEWGPSGSGVDGVPASVVAQVRWYIYLAGGTHGAWGYVGMLLGGNQYREYEIPHDAEWEAEAVAAAEAFWHDYIETMTPPPLEPRDTVDVGPAAPDAGIVSANAESEEAILALGRAINKHDATKATLEVRRNGVKELIGDNLGIQGPGYRVTYAPNKNGTRIFRPKFDKDFGTEKEA